MTSEIYEAIIKIEASKKENHIFPTHATFTDILNLTGVKREELETSIDNLADMGIIRTGRTINDAYIII